MGQRALAGLLRPAGDGPGARSLRAVQGMEVCSGVVGGRQLEARLRRLNARKWRLATVGSSDAHHLAQIGAARTRFAGRSPLEALRGAIAERTAEARWGPAGAVSPGEHARQAWRSLVLKPVREVRAAVRPGRQPVEARPPLRARPPLPAAYGRTPPCRRAPAEAPSKGRTTLAMVAPPRTRRRRRRRRPVPG